MFKDEEVHTFRAGRSMGHAAVNQFARGVRQLDEGKLQDIESTTCLGDFFAEIHRNATAASVINRDESPERIASPAPSSANSDDTGATSPRFQERMRWPGNMLSEHDLMPILGRAIFMSHDK
jgi:hypothetical protein